MSTATESTTSTDLVRSLFEAFGRRDIPFILDRVAADCRWICPGEMPYSGSYTGPAGAAEFFQKLSAGEEITRFEPGEYFTNGDDVVVLGYEEARALSTGKTAASHWAMIFRVRGGKVTHWQQHFDTGAYARAYGV